MIFINNIYCYRTQGVEFDAINENLDVEDKIKEFGYSCRKIYADEYFDDNALKL